MWTNPFAPARAAGERAPHGDASAGAWVATVNGVERCGGNEAGETHVQVLHGHGAVAAGVDGRAVEAAEPLVEDMVLSTPTHRPMFKVRGGSTQTPSRGKRRRKGGNSGGSARSRPRQAPTHAPAPAPVPVPRVPAVAAAPVPAPAGGGEESASPAGPVRRRLQWQAPAVPRLSPPAPVAAASPVSSSSSSRSLSPADAAAPVSTPPVRVIGPRQSPWLMGLRTTPGSASTQQVEARRKPRSYERTVHVAKLERVLAHQRRLRASARVGNAGGLLPQASRDMFGSVDCLLLEVRSVRRTPLFTHVLCHCHSPVLSTPHPIQVCVRAEAVPKGMALHEGDHVCARRPWQVLPADGPAVVVCATSVAPLDEPLGEQLSQHPPQTVHTPPRKARPVTPSPLANHMSPAALHRRVGGTTTTTTTAAAAAAVVRQHTVQQLREGHTNAALSGTLVRVLRLPTPGDEAPASDEAVEGGGRVPLVANRAVTCMLHNAGHDDTQPVAALLVRDAQGVLARVDVRRVDARATAAWGGVLDVAAEGRRVVLAGVFVRATEHEVVAGDAAVDARVESCAYTRVQLGSAAEEQQEEEHAWPHTRVDTLAQAAQAARGARVHVLVKVAHVVRARGEWYVVDGSGGELAARVGIAAARYVAALRGGVVLLRDVQVVENDGAAVHLRADALSSVVPPAHWCDAEAVERVARCAVDAPPLARVLADVREGDVVRVGGTVMRVEGLQFARACPTCLGGVQDAACPNAAWFCAQCVAMHTPDDVVSRKSATVTLRTAACGDVHMRIGHAQVLRLKREGGGARRLEEVCVVDKLGDPTRVHVIE